MQSLKLYLQSIDKPKFLIIRLKPIGDTVLLSPVFRNIKRLYPDAIIDIIIYPDVYDIIKNDPNLHKIIVLKRTFFDKMFFYTKSFFSRYNVIIDYINNPTSFMIALSTRSKVRIGNNKKRNFFYDYRLQDKSATYSAIRCLKKLDIIGLDSFDDYFPEITISNDDLKAADTFYTSIDNRRKYIGIFASAKYPSKKYPAHFFSELASLLAESTSYNILFLFGKGDYPTYYSVKNCTQYVNRIFYREPTTRLGELGALLSGISFLITGDTGPKHIATALNIPTLTVFGASDEKKWNPPDLRRFPVIRKKLSCAPCNKNHCPYATTSCMNELLPHEIFKACMSSLSELDLL
ncbi:glycosyltransferase family 9 protein [bacterium]|nr:glycosyltransferase family 9 protein [bacterium]